MAYDFRAQRLFVDVDLPSAGRLRLTREQSHYLMHVLRLSIGAPLLIFNGRDGEWLAEMAVADKKGVEIALIEQARPQPLPILDLHYGFAPLKQARLDYMAQKAVEMGAGLLRPVLTAHTQVARINEERLRANIIEAAEQCGILTIPTLAPMIKLDALLDGWQPGRALIFCDENAPATDPIAALAGVEGTSLAVLIGPEGGFSAKERATIAALPGCVVLSLGPRILRADTAAVAALALVQAKLGDWRQGLG